jgi:hypothetical protein
MIIMNRREWIKNASLASGMVVLPDYGRLNGNYISGNGNTGKGAVDHEMREVQENEIKEVHLINLSHTDFGYTDLPSSVWDDQMTTLRLAIRYITETKNYPPESRFKWTAESLWVVEHFLKEATAEEKNLFDKYVSQGSIEVTALPASFTPLCGHYELESEMERLSTFARKYKTTAAMQTDVNGLSYGLVELLLKRDVQSLVMQPNSYLSGNPVATPSFFWWQAPSGDKLLVYNGYHYAIGYEFFHNDGEWRKGPVPNKHDVWFNPPAGNEIFSSTPENLQKAAGILKSKLEELKKSGYHYPYLLLPFTNHLTMDNDIPCRQLSDFIKSWNEAGLKPGLVFTTPSAYVRRMKDQLPADTPVLKGEWSDWWATGIASTPFEVSVFQAAKRRNHDIVHSLKWTNKPEGYDKKSAALNYDLVLAAEHTWGAYDSVARPYGERTKGAFYQKMDVLMRSDEKSKRLKADIIRAGTNFKPFSQTKFFEILNPGDTRRSGWVDLSARAFRLKANGARELATGKIYPFLQTLASEWGQPDPAITAPPDFPNDVWPYFPAQYRFYANDLKPGETRKFELMNLEETGARPISESRYFNVKTDSNGCVTNIRYQPLQVDIFNTGSYLPGQIIVERPQGKSAREALASRQINPAHILHSSPVLVGAQQSATPYSLVYKSVWTERFAKRIEQQFLVFDAIPRIEITTTIWIKEILDPLAVYVALPFNVASPEIFYSSMGAQVHLGVSQMPGSCGEYQTLQNGVSIQGSDMSLAVSTLDCPLCVFDSLQRGTGRKVFKPQTAHIFNLVCENYWITNFAVIYPTKMTVRQVIDLGGANEMIAPLPGDEIWAYPC